MKARFYRGPWDGKTRTVPDDQYLIMVMVDNKKNLYGKLDFPTYVGDLTVRQHVYRKTRHTHPDGSVFFEWDKKKGTRI
jgi:hypothetical protein